MGLLSPRQGTPTWPCGVHQAVEVQDDGTDSTPPWGCLHRLGNLERAGEQSSVPARSTPTYSPTHCPPFLEVGGNGLLQVCYSWGRFSRCCPRPHSRDTRFLLHRQALTTGERRRASKNRRASVLAANLSNTEGSPSEMPQTPFLCIQTVTEPAILGSRTFNSSPLLIGFQFSDSHFLCFPI